MNKDRGSDRGSGRDRVEAMKASVGDMEIDVDVSIVKSEPVHQVNRSTGKPSNSNTANANTNASDSVTASDVRAQPSLLSSNKNSATDTNINITRSNTTSNNDVNMYKNVNKQSSDNMNNDSDRKGRPIASINNHISGRLCSSGDTMIRQQLDKQSALPGCNTSYSGLSSNSNSNSLHNSSSEVLVPSLVSSVPATIPICHALPSPFLPPPSTATPAPATGPFSGRITGQSMTPPVIISPPPLLDPRPHLVLTPSPSLGPFSTPISTSFTIAPCISSLAACDMMHIKREREDPLTAKQTTETLKTFNSHRIGGPSATPLALAPVLALAPALALAPTITTSTSNILEEAVHKKNRIEESAPMSGPFSSESVVLNSSPSLPLPLPIPNSNTPAVIGDR